MVFPGITVVQTECVSTHISLDVLFTLPKNFLLNIFGGLTRNPLLNTALVTALLVYARMNVFAQNAKKSYRAARRYAPRRSRRIYVRAQTDPQSARLWWPGLGAARLAGPGGTDRRTDKQTGGSRHR